LHPDVNASPDAPAAFDRARRAYRALMDRSCRAQVDRERVRVTKGGGTFTWGNIATPGAAGSESGVDDELGSAFDAVFGGG